MTTNLHAELDSSIVESIHFDKHIKLDELSNNISYGKIQDNSSFRTTIQDFLEKLSTYEGEEEVSNEDLDTNEIIENTNSIEIDDSIYNRNDSKVHRISLCEEKPKKSIFRFFTNRKTSSSPLVEINEHDELRVENKEAEIHISKLLSIAATYRKCDTEIKKAIVESRLKTTINLLKSYEKETSSSTVLWKKSNSRGNVIEYNLLNNYTKVSPTISNDENIDVDVSISTDISIGKSESDEWYSEVWDAIKDTNYETDIDYDSKNSINSKCIKNIRLELISQLHLLEHNNEPAISKIIHACIGYIHFRNDSYEKAVEEFALCDMTIDQSTVTFCLFKKLYELSKNHNSDKLFEENNKFDSNLFLKWAYSLHPLIGLQACRLLIGLLHFNVEKSITNKIQLTAYSAKIRSRLSMKLDSAQIVSKENFGIVRKRSTISVVETEYTWVDPTLEYKGKDKKLSFLNNTVVCTSSTSTPCQLSIDLLSRLIEFLQVIYNDGRSSSIKFYDEKEVRHLKVEVHPLYTELVHSSAFKEFERQCCQLQIADLNYMDSNELFLFFINIYNTLCIHACLREITSNGKGLNRDLQGFHFSTDAKYNIGGMYYSPVDIEYGIFRSTLSAPSMLDGALPLNYFTTTKFKSTDPRSKFIPDIPGKPNVTFILNSLTKLSPTFTVITDPENIDIQLKECARQFITRFIYINEATQTIYIPEQFRTYWKDFGGKRKYVIKFIAEQLSDGTSIEDKLIDKLTSMFHDGRKPIVDWMYNDDKKPVFLF